MISRWVTFFSLALAACSEAATLTGHVELQDSRETSVRKGHDYSGVVVWLEPLNGKSPQPQGPGKATMLQKNKRFVPHVLAVRTGTAVDFPNLDPIFHNAFSNFSGQIFDIGLYKPGSSRTVNFNRAGVVRVFCNIHSAMSAVIVVMDTPWFATTSVQGTFRITNVPPGEYRLRVFHERAMPAELMRAERTVAVGAADLPALQLAVSETGFLPTPHADKHGKEYRPADDDYKVMK